MTTATLTRRPRPRGPATADAETQTVTVMLSSGASTRQYGPRPDGTWGAFDEVLSLAGADLSRMAGAPVMVDHRRDTAGQAGVVDRAWIGPEGLMAEVRLSKSDLGRQMWADIADGVRRQFSIGYTVQRYVKVDSRSSVPAYRAEKWMPHEASIVPVGAEHGAGVRSLQTQEDPMENDVTPAFAPADDRGTPADVNAQIERAVQAERARSTDIMRRVRAVQLPETLAHDLIARGVTLDQAATVIVDELAATRGGKAVLPWIEGGVDHTDPSAIRERMAGALAHRLSHGSIALDDQSREFGGASLLSMIRGLMEARGERVGFLSDADLMSRSIGLGTSDLPQLTTSTGNRVLLDAFQRLGSPLLPVFRRSTSPDFRPLNRLRVGEAPALKEIGEQSEVEYGAIGEQKESYIVKSYGRRVALSRKAIINDDLNAFGDMLGELGRASADILAEALFGVITGNGLTMSDGHSQYDATNHKNKAASGTTIDLTNVGVAVAAMRNQTGVDGSTRIYAAPKYLVVGSAMEMVARQFVASIYATKTSDVNPLAQMLEVIVEPRIADNSWRLFASPATTPSGEYAELDGSRPLSSGPGGPLLEAREGWSTSGMEFRCIYDVGAGAIGWQGTYLNAGT